jgi:hypothetical protein
MPLNVATAIVVPVVMVESLMAFCLYGVVVVVVVVVEIGQSK